MTAQIFALAVIVTLLTALVVVLISNSRSLASAQIIAGLTSILSFNLVSATNVQYADLTNNLVFAAILVTFSIFVRCGQFSHTRIVALISGLAMVASAVMVMLGFFA